MLTRCKDKVDGRQAAGLLPFPDSIMWMVRCMCETALPYITLDVQPSRSALSSCCTLFTNSMLTCLAQVIAMPVFLESPLWVGLHSKIATFVCRWYNEDMLLDPYAPLISGRRRFGVRDDVEEFEEKVLVLSAFPAHDFDLTLDHKHSQNLTIKIN